MSNKAMVLAFYQEVFANHNVSNIDKYMKDTYIQHNPNCEDGKAGFLKFAEKFLSMNPRMDIIHIGEDGDLVYVFFKCTMSNGSINKVCDIYRIENGLLAEHWDIIEHNVEQISPLHNNGLF